MLEGKLVNLRVMEKEDLPLFAEWFSKPEFLGEYNPLRQMSRTEIEKDYDVKRLANGIYVLRQVCT